jgi:hypothetical protein
MQRGSYFALAFLIGEVALNTGMRQGNCFVLQWKRVQRGTINVL